MAARISLRNVLCVTSLDVNDADSIATLEACSELGVNFVDTAYCYGPNGESENLVRQALAPRRDEFVLATKCGIHYNAEGKQTNDARPETIVAECDESAEELIGVLRRSVVSAHEQHQYEE